MRGLVDRRPVERGVDDRLLRQRIWHLVVVSRVGLGEFLSPPVAHRFRKIALEVAEKWKWLARGPFLAHEHQGRPRSEQRDGQGCFERRNRRQLGEPFAERAIADLVMVLQKIDEGGGGKGCRRFATSFAPAVRRRFALVGKSFAQDSGGVSNRVPVVAVITRGLAGQQHMEGMVVVVVPLRPVFAARRIGHGIEQA
jgi:hypothetical protein